ncbi:hypothetical protein [Paenibacillus medicaginis]|uniref:Uncharacterized protein n=1 Tax=Paenibacillus medicaginis TaxID=1470560 RepID=A0ABV5C1Z1_9BACL
MIKPKKMMSGSKIAIMSPLKSILFCGEFPYTYTPFPQWTNGYQDWSSLETLGECQEFYEYKQGWTFLQGEDVEQGLLWGGCIEVLEFMKATAYWPEPSFWQAKDYTAE